MPFLALKEKDDIFQTRCAQGTLYLLVTLCSLFIIRNLIQWRHCCIIIKMHYHWLQQEAEKLAKWVLSSILQFAGPSLKFTRKKLDKKMEKTEWPYWNCQKLELGKIFLEKLALKMHKGMCVLTFKSFMCVQVVKATICYGTMYVSMSVLQAGTITSCH